MITGGAGWVTNDPEAARKLRAIDRDYEKVKAGTVGLSLAGKVETIRKAKAARRAAYDAILTENPAP
jgi:hypothetical protein